MPSRRAHPAPRPLAQRISRAARNLATLAEGAVMLAVASLVIRWLPFRYVMTAAGWRGVSRHFLDAPATARRVRWAVERLADAAPWRAVCFQRGLAVHWMLRRRGIPSFLYYGIDGRTAAGISAHVWVMLDGDALIGGADAARHACVMIRPEPNAG